MHCIKDVISNCEDVSGFPLPKISNLGSYSGKGSIDKFLALGTLSIGSVLTMVQKAISKAEILSELDP